MPTIGRPREFDRSAALKSAMEVFWRQGFEATQVEDLVEAMGIGRGSMYAAFGDKRSLYLEALEAFVAGIAGWYRDKVLAPGSDPLDNLRGMIARWPEVACSAEKKGCFLTNSLIERGASDPDVAAIARRTLRGEEMLYRGVLGEAQERGRLGKDKDVGMIARAIVNARLGVTLQARLGGAAEGAQAAAAATLALLA